MIKLKGYLWLMLFCWPLLLTAENLATSEPAALSVGKLSNLHIPICGVFVFGTRRIPLRNGAGKQFFTSFPMIWLPGNGSVLLPGRKPVCPKAEIFMGAN